MIALVLERPTQTPYSNDYPLSKFWKTAKICTEIGEICVRTFAVTDYGILVKKFSLVNEMIKKLEWETGEEQLLRISVLLLLGAPDAGDAIFGCSLQEYLDDGAEWETEVMWKYHVGLDVRIRLHSCKNSAS